MISRNTSSAPKEDVFPRLLYSDLRCSQTYRRHFQVSAQHSQVLPGLSSVLPVTLTASRNALLGSNTLLKLTHQSCNGSNHFRSNPVSLTDSSDSLGILSRLSVSTLLSTWPILSGWTPWKSRLFWVPSGRSLGTPETAWLQDLSLLLWRHQRLLIWVTSPCCNPIIEDIHQTLCTRMMYWLLLAKDIIFSKA
jgi:hypothetical protein